MNYKLLQDIEIAYGKLKKINEANIKIMELNNRKDEINQRYGEDKKTVLGQTIYEFLIFMIPIGFVVTLIGGALLYEYVWRKEYSNTLDLLPLCAVWLIPLFIKNIFYCKIKNKKNEKWWKTEAQAELQQIDNTINKLKQLISSTMNNDYVLSNIRPGLRNEEAIAGMYNIVKSNYADDIKTAQSIWIDQEYYRLQRENAERAARKKEQQLAALNGRLDEINSHLEHIELMEELKYWERASKR